MSQRPAGGEGPTRHNARPTIKTDSFARKSTPPLSAFLPTTICSLRLMSAVSELCWPNVNPLVPPACLIASYISFAAWLLPIAPENTKPVYKECSAQLLPASQTCKLKMNIARTRWPLSNVT